MGAEHLVATLPVRLRGARTEGGRVARSLPAGVGLGRPPSQGADRRCRVGHALERGEAPFGAAAQPPRRQFHDG